jgi:hypothetical protein
MFCENLQTFTEIKTWISTFKNGGHLVCLTLGFSIKSWAKKENKKERRK